MRLSKNSITWYKCLIQLTNSNGYMNTFPWNNHHILICYKALCVLSILLLRILKRQAFNGWILIKLIMLTAPSCIFSCETGFFLFCFVFKTECSRKNTMITSTVWCHCHLISTKMPTVLPTIVLVSVRQMSKQWEQQEVSITMKKVLTSQTP